MAQRRDAMYGAGFREYERLVELGFLERARRSVWQ